MSSDLIRAHYVEQGTVYIPSMVGCSKRKEQYESRQAPDTHVVTGGLSRHEQYTGAFPCCLTLLLYAIDGNRCTRYIIYLRVSPMVRR